MKHWKTKEEMGEGFSFTEKQHKKYEYNSLVNVCNHEKNLMRTFYLIRDVWTNPQLKELQRELDQELNEREIA
jgi:hypothetical protein